MVFLVLAWRRARLWTVLACRIGAETVENLEKLEATGASEETVTEIFNDPSSSNYIVVFAR